MNRYSSRLSIDNMSKVDHPETKLYLLETRIGTKLMIEEIALQHFEEIWQLFDESWLHLRGSKFLLDPLRIFTPEIFAYSLTRKRAIYTLH